MTLEAPISKDEASLLAGDEIETAFDDDASTGEEAARAPRRKVLPGLLPTFDFAFLGLLLVSSLGFFAVAVTIAYEDPEYFQKRLIASLLRDNSDKTSTGALRGANGSSQPGIDGLPAPTIVRDRPLTPADYEIVMVYGGEAILATKEELMRVKVGSSVPGLGQVKSILPSETGGTVLADEATLRTVAN